MILALRALAGAGGPDRAARESPGLSGNGKWSELSINGDRPEPSVDVDEDLLRERARTYIVDHYTGLHNTVISVVLAAAGFCAASLAGSHAQYGSSYPLLWMLWVASFLLCATIFAGTMVGTLAAPPMMPAISDLLLPLLLGVGEFVLFGVLAQQVTGLKTISSVAEAWFISLAVVCVFAAAAITRVMRFFGAATYAATIIGPIDEYRSDCLPADRKGALITGVIGMGGAAASAVQVGWLEFVLAGCVIVGLLLGLRGHAESAAILQPAMQQARSASATQPDGGNVASRQETGTGRAA